MGRDMLLLSLMGYVVLARSDEVSAIKLKSAAPTILESKFVDKTCPFAKLEGTEGLRKDERTEKNGRSPRSSTEPSNPPPPPPRRLSLSYTHEDCSENEKVK